MKLTKKEQIIVKEAIEINESYYSRAGWYTCLALWMRGAPRDLVNQYKTFMGLTNIDGDRYTAELALDGIGGSTETDDLKQIRSLMLEFFLEAHK